MESLKFLLCVAFLAFAFAEPIGNKEAVEPPVKAISETEPVEAVAETGERVKKSAAYYGYPYSAYPYSAYPYGHSYSYYQPYYGGYSYYGYDDGKYWPGKYEKVSYYPKTYPYYSAYPYHGYPYHY